MSNTTISQLKDNKAKLEAELLSSILTLVSDFERANGVTVDYVSVDMASTHSMGEPKPRFFIDSVDVGIDLY